MKLTSLKLNPFSIAGMDWYVRFGEAFESGDPERVGRFLHDDVVLELNDFLPFYGKQTVCMALERYWVATGAMEYEPLNVYGDDFKFSAEVLAHRAPHSGGTIITIPFAVFYEREHGGQLKSLRLFMDLLPIYGSPP